LKPTIVLVGRPNVGKSTLFNRLTRSRDALVADVPGLTRDRQYGIAKTASRDFIVVDTGGMGEAPSPAYVSDFLATSDGLSLTKAFMKIKNSKLRRRIVDLVEQIAGED